jgi:hypothetical protein
MQVCVDAFKIAVSEPEASSEPKSSATSPVEPKPFETCGTLFSATPSIADTKRGSVPKRRFQKGTLLKRGDNWVGMWRVDALQYDGTTKREQRCQTFPGVIGTDRQSSVSTNP